MENCSNDVTNENSSNHLGNLHKCDKCHSGDCNYQNFGSNVQQTENDIKMDRNGADGEDGEGDPLIDDQNKNNASENYGVPVACHRSQVASFEKGKEGFVDPTASEMEKVKPKPLSDKGVYAEASTFLDIAEKDSLANILRFVDEERSAEKENTENRGFQNVEVDNKATLIEVIVNDGNEILENNNPISPIKLAENAMETCINPKEMNAKVDNNFIDFDILAKSNIDHGAPSVPEHEQQFEFIYSTQPDNPDEYGQIESDLETIQSNHSIEINPSEGIKAEILEIANDSPPNENTKQICHGNATETLTEPEKAYKKYVTYYCTDLKNLCDNETDDQIDIVRTAENSDESDDETRLSTPPEGHIGYEFLYNNPL